ncbi:MAG: sigma-54 dependent transcriptional regulator [bacterium]|nr:sigma-54 dependent transcriptional regulator [bacterium]
MKDRILIVDDEESSRVLCHTTLASPEREIVLCPDAEAALEQFRKMPFDLVLTDMIMPGISGLELLERIKAERSDTSVLLMSGKGTISAAVQAMKLGAEEFIEKPLPDPEVLSRAVNRVLRARKLERENQELRRELAALKERPVLIGGEALSQLLRTVEKIAPLDTTVLITGETGTGKELIARRVHTLSPRAHRPFVAMNCGSLPEGLLESLLFGHEKGAFTGAIKRSSGYFEVAEGGTVFLDEIGDMPPTLQVKLLRVLQEKTYRRVGGDNDLAVDCRIIAATHRDLPQMVDRGDFREDLFYRLNVINLQLPPLRERRSDIPALIAHIIKVTSAQQRRTCPKLDPTVLQCLTNYAWPGNIRELQNVLERAVALCSDDLINPMDLPESLQCKSSPQFADFTQNNFGEAKDDFERSFILNALKEANNSVSQAAQATGIPRQNFYLKIKKYGIKIQEIN